MISRLVPEQVHLLSRSCELGTAPQSSFGADFILTAAEEEKITAHQDEQSITAHFPVVQTIFTMAISHNIFINDYCREFIINEFG